MIYMESKFLKNRGLLFINFIEQHNIIRENTFLKNNISVKQIRL